MTTKPLPAHGTYARANGCPGYREPCKCDPCHKELRRVRKLHNVNRQLGRPGLVDATPAREHLQTLLQQMTWEQIFTASGCDSRNLQLVADGRRTQIRRSTLTQILAVQPAPTARGKYVDATGTRRRIQALRAIGYSAKAIAKAAGSAEARMQLISSGAQPTVRHWLAEKINTVFVELHDTPAPASCSATMTRNHAKAQGWAPPAAWDDIDDPAAVPDWTGYCGTDRGWWTHRRQNLPMCPRCEHAHQNWLAERADLDPHARSQEMFRARAAASQREAELADDARELLRYGVRIEQAAERLGVSKNHLQQAMLRHPAEQPAAA
ncbi:hypothetical protein [Streptomyces mutabilis]|uniref:hypothetical protein n=1 Tax=Streptomyces mutabilis TaxID=67332 RepID=UPI003694B49D